MKDQDQAKQKILETLRKTPIVGIACARAGISRATFYRWVEEDKHFKKRVTSAVKLGNAELNDLAIGKLLQNIKNGQQGAIAFHLSRRHPSYRKPQRLKVEVIEKDKGISLETLRDIKAEDIPKRLRKSLLRRELAIKSLVVDIINETERQNPRPGRRPLVAKLALDNVDWGALIRRHIAENQGEK